MSAPARTLPPPVARGWKFERVSNPPLAAQILVPIASIIAALIVGSVIMLFAGENPLGVYREMFDGAFGSNYRRSETVVKTIPLLLTGLGVAVAFRMRLWNIGAEGQFYFGAVFATWVALYGLPSSGAWVVIPAMMVAGMLGGALWGGIPGVLRGYLGVNETITSLMLNYVAILFASWLVHGPWKNPVGFGFPGTVVFSPATYLPTWGTTRVHLGLVFGLIAAVILYFVLQRTRWGYEISIAGHSERVARYAGMATGRNMVIVMLVSGGLAGLAGMSELAGNGHSLQRELSPGYGYTAIIVAWLGRLNPFGIIVVSFLLAGLLVGGEQIQLSLGLPSAIAPMLQGIILFFLLGGDLLTRYRIVRVSTTKAAS